MKLRKIVALVLAMAMAFAFAATVSAEEAPASGKVLNIGIVTDPQVLNPLNDNNGTAFELSKIMFMPLMDINADVEFVPGVASEITTEDNVVYTIKLQEGLVWCDGEPITADDVIFTLNTLTNPVVGSTVASYCSHILGTEDTGWMAEGVSELEGVKKVSDTELTIECKVPTAMNSFMNDIAYRVRTVPKHILEGETAENILKSEFAVAPVVGNGPFLFKEYLSGQYISMVANPTYYKGQPKLDQINFAILSTTQVATQLETGEIDMAYPGSIDVDAYDQLNSLDYIVSEQSAPVSVRTFMINNSIFPLEVRQAINLAIDRDTIIDKLMGGYANAQATVVTDASKYFNAEAAQTTYDPAAAMALMAAATDFDASQTYKLGVASGSDLNTKIAVLVSAELAAIGIKTEIVESDMPTLMSGLFSKNYELAIMNITDNPMNLPFNFSAICNSASDWTGYSNPHMDELLAVITSVADEDTIAAAYAEIQEIIAADVPAVTVYASRPLVFWNTKITEGKPRLYGMFADVDNWDIQ